VATLGAPGVYVWYAASKGAIDTMTIGLAKELAEDGIRVNCVRPGFVNTDIHAGAGEPDRIERLRDSIPMKRGGEPEEVGRHRELHAGHRRAELARGHRQRGQPGVGAKRGQREQHAEQHRERERSGAGFQVRIGF